MLYTKNANATSTTEQTIVTIPNGYVAHWNMLYVVNIGGSTNGANLKVNKADSTTLDILGGGNISSKEYVLLTDGVFVLQAGDAVVCSLTAAGDMEFVITFDLLEAPATFVNFNGA